MIRNINSKNWQDTFPVLIKPFQGESLYGYLLRLDDRNNFSFGTTMDMIKRYDTGRICLNRPGLFSCGTIFDLERLSSLSGVSFDKITGLTIIQTLKRLFRLEHVYPALVGSSKVFNICPICIKECKFPLIHTFRNINSCMEHKVFLHSKCLCGSEIKLFSSQQKCFYCPDCNNFYGDLNAGIIDSNSTIYQQEIYLYEAYQKLLYTNISFVKDTEDLSQGFEDRLQFISYKQSIEHGKFKKKFGFDIDNLKNGHGLMNISLAKLLDVLYTLGYTPEAFRDIEINKSTRRIAILDLPNNSEGREHTCPNIHCRYFKELGKGNIKYYGKKKNHLGKYLIEEYCNECGTRFLGNNIIQSYDYNPGLRQYDIEKARERITKWQENLKKTCSEMIEKRIPITLTGCFKSAKIPIGKTYFANRLKLIAILEEFSDIQRLDTLKWRNELQETELNLFLRRIYKKRKQKI